MNFIKVSGLAALLISAGSLTAGDRVTVSKDIQGILERYCTDCHGAKKKKGDIRLHDIGSLETDFQSNILNKIEEQLYIKKMPPDDEDQLSAKELKQLGDWINSQYKVLGEDSKFQAKLKTPAFGNYVNHDELFSGKHKDLPGFTPDRRWLISEYIFTNKANKVLNSQQNKNIYKKRRSIIGSSKRSGINITNPFLLSSDTGVRYYDNTMLNSGHLLTMITNAKEISKYLMNERQMRGIAPMYNVMKLEFDHDNELAKRKKFLDDNITELMQHIYGKDNEGLLPKFVSLNMKATPVSKDGKSYILPNGKKVKKPNHDTASSRSEYPFIKTAIKKYYISNQTHEELILLCEKEWYEAGVSEMKVKTRLSFMLNYMGEILRRNKFKPDQNQPKVFKDADIQVYIEAIRKHRKKGDFHNVVIEGCLNEWKNGFESQRREIGPPKDPEVKEIVKYLFNRILDREASESEVQEHITLLRNYINALGTREALGKFIETLVLRSEFVYRYEFGKGDADKHGRKMMSPEDASFALSYALTENAPDAELRKAVQQGKLSTREDYEREVKRMLKKRDQWYLIDERIDFRGDGVTNTPIRKLRFFRDFFGYPNFWEIFKDNKRFGGGYDRIKGRVLEEADKLVDHIISQDKNVFEELLTSEKYYVYHSGDNEQMKKASDDIKNQYEYFKDLDWKNFKYEDFLKHKDFIVKSGISHMRGKGDARWILRTLKFLELRNKNGKTPDPHKSKLAQNRAGNGLGEVSVAKFFNVDFSTWDYPTTQPAKVPNRKGILSHPAWLMAHAQNTETDPVIRGKWVREKLLAGTIPDVPITVEAVVPENHHKTMRTRLAEVTEVKYCWKCHKYMNPLGYAFEMFDDFGRFRTEESLEHPDNLVKKNPDKGTEYEDLRDIYKTKPVDSSGHLKGTGDEKLEGEVKNALELVERLSKSDRVRQSIIRHAFRYFIGRNEVLSDSKTLIDSDQAYIKSGGSFDAVIVSLLTSDSFIYRKNIKELK